MLISPAFVILARETLFQTSSECNLSRSSSSLYPAEKNEFLEHSHLVYFSTACAHCSVKSAKKNSMSSSSWASVVALSAKLLWLLLIAVREVAFRGSHLDRNFSMRHSIYTVRILSFSSHQQTRGQSGKETKTLEESFACTIHPKQKTRR